MESMWYLARTPGRVVDMIKQRAVRTRVVKLLVLDEFDEMLSQGFKEKIYEIYRYLPPTIQTPRNFPWNKESRTLWHSLFFVGFTGYLPG
ncbi:hypothetical protein IFM89_037149 [Coptis chinensis]|uniref:DEAD/DEAH-box helicase domain-containing protein n=1 Tax=Coptis chinensis TaxID=261450 RepID=A0A835HRP0_9MAGN|nr:hypothetical protein IFM89_037149 [Coptis chinensis]